MAATISSATPHTLFLQKKTQTPPPCFRKPSQTSPRFRKPSQISCTATTTPTQVAPTSTAYSRHVFNFAAGPATLPESVLLRAQSELFDFRNSGMSIMEMSHRGKEFDSVIKNAESDLRQLLSVPSDYSLLFLQGGATTQFAAVPLNLLPAKSSLADYVVTGS